MDHLYEHLFLGIVSLANLVSGVPIRKKPEIACVMNYSAYNPPVLSEVKMAPPISIAISRVA